MTDLQALHDTTHTMVMGVLNITEDSVSDGGLWLDPAKAAQHGRDMMAAGADIIDIGAESTRPGAKRVSEADELVRITGAVKTLIPAGAVLSIDTTRASVAAAALSEGAQIIASDSDAYVLARQGLDTLAMIVDEAARIRPGSVIADLKIARGLDYYTGSVYETFLDGAAALGSICSGGRYDNLASQGNKKYPGVGLSIGLSRLVSYMLHTAGAHANRVSPASVLVAVWNEADRSASNLIANQLRSRGIAADVAPTAAKLGKQIKYADKLGIPYVWFPADASEEGAQDEVKNIITGDQRPADTQSWEPDTVYAQQTVTVEA